MRKATKIALAAGALTLAGAVTLSNLATAENRGSGNWGQHGGASKGHGMGMMGMHGMGHKGMGMMGMRGMGHKGMGMMGMNRMLERFDSNEDGKLTQEELNGARKKLLATHDANKDGKLSLAEYEKLWLAVKRQRMVRSFQRTDRDGDASITVDEFLKPYAKMVSRMDRNKDGALDSNDRGHKRGGMGMGMGKGGMGMGQGGMGMGQGGMDKGGMGMDKGGMNKGGMKKQGG